MRKKLFALVASALVLISAFTVVSCLEPAFPDDNLDFYWRLDRIEYRDGKDFQGQSCLSKDVDDIMFGFARHIVLIEAPGLSKQHGITTATNDSITLDYSIYNDATLAVKLQDCGLDSIVSTFKVEYPDRKHLVLSGCKTILRFRKW
jgi:hypothetical protein